MSYVVTEPVKVNCLIFFFFFPTEFQCYLAKKMPLSGILESFNIHVVFVFLWRVILDDGRLHRFVCGICSLQSRS